MSGSEKSVCSIFTKRRKFWNRLNKIPSQNGRRFLFNITQNDTAIKNVENAKKNAIGSDGIRYLWNFWKSYLIPAPLSKSAFTVNTASFPVLSLAARSIPFDSCPISFAGWRFVTTTIIFPTKSSGL